MITVREAIHSVMNDATDELDKGRTIHATLVMIERRMIDLFAWHPIEFADEFGLRTPPPGKKWGPRVIVMMNDGPAVAYWDPDQTQPDGSPVAAPAPYWRAVQKQAGWSRRAIVTHFLRPYAVDIKDPRCK